jgi:hypothetical protein
MLVQVEAPPFFFCICSKFGESAHATAYTTTMLDADIDMMNKVIHINVSEVFSPLQAVFFFS